MCVQYASEAARAVAEAPLVPRDVPAALQVRQHTGWTVHCKFQHPLKLLGHDQLLERMLKNAAQ